jgi:hypothetical protein
VQATSVWLHTFKLSLFDCSQNALMQLDIVVPVAPEVHGGRQYSRIQRSADHWITMADKNLTPRPIPVAMTKATSLQSVIDGIADATDVTSGHTRRELFIQACSLTGAASVVQASTELKRQLQAYHHMQDFNVKVHVDDGGSGGQRIRFRMVRSCPCMLCRKAMQHPLWRRRCA